MREIGGKEGLYLMLHEHHTLKLWTESEGFGQVNNMVFTSNTNSLQEEGRKGG